MTHTSGYASYGTGATTLARRDAGHGVRPQHRDLLPGRRASPCRASSSPSAASTTSRWRPTAATVWVGVVRQRVVRDRPGHVRPAALPHARARHPGPGLRRVVRRQPGLARHRPGRRADGAGRWRRLPRLPDRLPDREGRRVLEGRRPGFKKVPDSKGADSASLSATGSGALWIAFDDDDDTPGACAPAPTPRRSARSRTSSPRSPTSSTGSASRRRRPCRRGPQRRHVVLAPAGHPGLSLTRPPEKWNGNSSKR